MNYISLILTCVISFAISLLLYIIFIPVLRRVKLGQKILEIGPKWHKSKEGTPTMGGLFFITAMALTIGGLYLSGVFDNTGMFFPINLCFALINAAIGFVDDYVKLFKKRNEGLTVFQKLALQVAATAAYLAALKLTGCITTQIPLPFSGNTVDLGAFYYILVGVIIVYIINTANLTDGLDGLAGSVAFVIAALFVIVGINARLVDLYLTEAALGGALIAFLIFNFYPAKVFMGDTGSLFLGSMLVGCAMRLGRPLVMILVGLVYVLEGVSVMIQVFVFKITHGKKRFFKMAPIHHHLELCGLSEIKIMAIFLAVTAALCALSYFLVFAPFVV